MDTSTLVSGPHFRICPLCEASRLVFSGLHDARCPACGYEPSDGFLITLRQIVTLPEAPETRPERLRARRSGPKKGSDEQEGGDPEEDR